MLSFAKRGGKAYLLCSPELEPADIESITLGYARRSSLVSARLDEQIDALLSDNRSAFAVRVLATLITVGALEIKLAVPSDRRGIYHEKLGVFRDAFGNRVSFKGSANETWSGWDDAGNFESIEVFCSWRDGLEERRVHRHNDHFDMLWSEEDPHVEVFPFPDNAIEKLRGVALSDLESIPNGISLPKRRSILPHQSAAIQSWMANGYRGILQHATGSGKTFTAIQAIGSHTATGLPALVLVPSTLLLNQWADEIREELPGLALLLAGAGNDRWKERLRLESMSDPSPDFGGRAILATMQTASTPEFLARLCQGNHLLIVADEVHQTGSRQNSRIFSLEAGKRLGLSATPTRYGDPDGTQKMMGFFGGIVPPPITLNDAIAAGRLVQYEYFPHLINLDATEADEWRSVTKLIQQELSRSKKDDNVKAPLSERAKMLLIRRSRIAKKASAKVRLASDVIRENYEDGQSWLVYCEDSDQVNSVLGALQGLGVKATEYHSNMRGDREATLKWFRDFGGVLVSIKCLDEGVDIPSVSHGLILASSQNPRQFIQRRGRVLRRSPGKDMAVIHDAIVTPVDPENEKDQLSLLKAELVRAVEFSSNAINRSSGTELRQAASRMGIDPDELIDDGIEGEDE